MRIKIGYSPCPNDTFIFFALVHGAIDTKGLQFEPYLADVEELNQLAIRSELAVTKISFNAFLSLTSSYVLLDSGAALGRNCGPLLIGKEVIPTADVRMRTIGIPGEQTTANFLLDYYLPGEKTKKIMLFNEIEQAVLDDEIDLGVIIHENRFTYTDRGLVLIQDLGSYWEGKTGHPIPLGGIVAQRNQGKEFSELMQDLIRQSIEFARSYPDQVMPYVRKHAQEMEEEVMMQHIGLYVNDFSLSLGKIGRKAIVHLFHEAILQGRIEAHAPVFI